MKKITLLFSLIAFTFSSQAQFDTTGLHTWPHLYNSYSTWMQGAFDAHRNPNDQADFGWGNYDMSTHLITGDSIYIIHTVNDSYKAISIDQVASGVYTISHSNLDFSDYTTKTLDRKPYSSKNFFYYSIDNDVVKDLEPASTSWDILFTKFPVIYPGFGAYSVAGVLHNVGVRASQVEFATGQSPSVSDTINFPMSSNISTVGYDWKDAFNGIVYDTLAYYVEDQNGNVNELMFTGYGGSATGKMVFEVNDVADSVVLGQGNSDQVYYSLQTMNEVKTNTDHDWDIALYAQASFSAIPVRINGARGAELFVYPKSDISFWNAVGIDEHTVNVISVYPNPTTDFINIALQADMPHTVQATIVDAAGRVVLTQDIDTRSGVSESRISVAHLLDGLYTVQLTGKGFVATSRIVVKS